MQQIPISVFIVKKIVMSYILQYYIQNTNLEQYHHTNAKFKKHNHTTVHNYHTWNAKVSLIEKIATQNLFHEENHSNHTIFLIYFLILKSISF